jgi:branched-chain amino acid transport system substrate-binding protein
MNRFVSLTAILLSLMIAIMGCQRVSKELKVAVLAPLSGPVPAFGVSMRDGALLAIDEWNARGGVLNMKITPIVEDSQCAPDVAVNATSKVINQDKVHYIIGDVCSQASIPMSEVANTAKVIQISPSSTDTAVTVDKNGATKAYVFRVCFVDPFQGKVAATFAARTLKARKAFILFDQGNASVKGLADAFVQTFTQLGGMIVGKESCNGAADSEYSAILAKVKSAKPDIIYMPASYNVVNMATRQARGKGILAPFMGDDGWDSSDLDVKAADGSYYTSHFNATDPRPEVRSFLKAYEGTYKENAWKAIEPDASAALAYDATNLLLTALRNAGADNSDKVRAALEGISYVAVSGRIVFDAQHNPVKGAVIMHVRDGRRLLNSFVSP